jgi:hypothetical protein
MCYELSDYEWTTIKLMLPNKPRGVPRVNDRRVLRRPRCRRPDDRHLHCPRASAWSLHHKEPAPFDGKITRRLDKQNSCGVDSNGLPMRLALSPGEAHDVRLAGKLLSSLKSGSLLADRN